MSREEMLMHAYAENLKIQFRTLPKEIQVNDF
jgi:hypothetical protein